MLHRITPQNVTFPPGRGDTLTVSQLKLILDVVTPEGCRAELTFS